MMTRVGYWMRVSMTKVNLSLNEQAANSEHVLCKSCQHLKIRIKAGYYPNGKDGKFVDPDMREWNGRVCPDCHVVSLKVKQKISRAKDKIFKEKANAKRRERYKLTGK